MVKTGKHIWDRHPAVNNDLTLGDRAADFLKRWFGTWTALGVVAGWILVWVVLQKTSFHWDLYPFILLNLCLSCLAAVQGIILQISANRQDRINAEAAEHDHQILQVLKEQSEQLLTLQTQQMSILDALEHANAELDLLKEAEDGGHDGDSDGDSQTGGS